MSEYLSIQFEIGPNKNARAMLGAMIEEAGEERESLLALVHRYKRDDGKIETINGRSPYQVISARETMVIRAFGEEGTRFLASKAHLIAGWLSKNMKTTVPISWKGGVFSIEPAKQLQTYWLGDLVVEKHPRKRQVEAGKKRAKRFRRALDACRNRDPSQFDVTAIEGRIRRGLEAQCDLLGIDPPEDGLMVSVQSIEDTAMREFVPGHYMPAASGILFTLNARLVGPWNVGPGASKGFGRIWRQKANEQRQAA